MKTATANLHELFAEAREDVKVCEPDNDYRKFVERARVRLDGLAWVVDCGWLDGQGDLVSVRVDSLLLESYRGGPMEFVFRTWMRAAYPGED